LAVLRQLQADLGRGLPPATRLVEGALVLVGAVLLVTPGMLTDVFGIFLLIPPTRRLIAPITLRWLARRFQLPLDPAADPTAGPRPPPALRRSPFDHPMR
jgi:UPF0716 protein FxsA